MAAHDAGGQAGRVGLDKADAVDVDAQQLGRAHPGGQVQRHIVAPAAVNVLHAVDLPRAQRGEAGAGRQHVVLQLAFGDVLDGALDAAQAAHLGHDKAEMNGRAPHGVLVDQAVDGLGQRLDVQPAAAYDVEEEAAQLVGAQRLRHLQYVVDLQPAPQCLGLVDLAHREKAAVQRTDTGARDDVRLPVQLFQRAPDADLVAALCAAARQHQRAFRCFIYQFHAGVTSRDFVATIIAFSV